MVLGAMREQLPPLDFSMFFYLFLDRSKQESATLTYHSIAWQRSIRLESIILGQSLNARTSHIMGWREYELVLILPH
jgi:hypothetical protein